MKNHLTLIIIQVIYLACNKAGSKINNEGKYYNKEYSSETDTNYEDAENDNSNENDDNENKIYDGTYDAIVSHHNPDTQYSATYTLEVDVEDGEVIKINFSKGGWLDDDVHPEESRLYPEEIDENGEATLQDENGRTFEVHIEI